MAALVGAVAVIGCSEDEGSGGTAGSGGTGGGVAEPCTEGLCAADSEPERLCNGAIDFCDSLGAGGAGGAAQPSPTPAQCDRFGNLFCEPDFGGAGGAGGDGGPGAAEVCAFCNTDDQTAIDDCEATYNECQDSLEECVVLALLECEPPRTVQVFVTSDTFDGNFVDQAGGDAACNAAGTAEGLAGTWVAWLGRGSCRLPSCMTAKDRIPDGEYHLLNQTVVALDKDDLTDGTLLHAINLTEQGTTLVGDEHVWTGTIADGTGGEVGTCTVWATNDVGIRGRVGVATATDETWSDLGEGDPDTGGDTCNTANRLYCFTNPEVFE
jgi:hypothetical protein